MAYTMHDVPLQMSQLRHGLESSFDRQMADHRRDQDARLRDTARVAEDAAVSRSEELLAPQLLALGERTRTEFHAMRVRADAEEEKLRQVETHTAAAHQGLADHSQRSSLIEGRLEVLEAQAKEAKHDRRQLHDLLKRCSTELTMGDNECERRRGETESAIRRSLSDAADLAAAATKAALDEATRRADNLEAKLLATDGRLSSKLEAGLELARGEAKAGDGELAQIMRRVRDISSFRARRQQRMAEALAASERRTTRVAAEVRAEMHDTATHTLAVASSELNARSSELTTSFSDGLQAARAYSDGMKANNDCAIHDTAVSIHESLASHRSAMDAENLAVHRCLSESESRCAQQLSETENRMARALEQRVDNAVIALQQDLGRAQQALTCLCSDARREASEQLRHSSERADRNLGAMRAQWEVSIASTTSQSAAKLRADFETLLRDAEKRAESHRSTESDRAQKSQKELMQLAAELERLRCASSCLAAGTFKALRLLGLLREEVDVTGHGRLIEDLLAWERTGRGLAARIGEAPPAPLSTPRGGPCPPVASLAKEPSGLVRRGVMEAPGHASASRPPLRLDPLFSDAKS